MHGAKLRPNSRSCRNFSQTPQLISQRKVAVQLVITLKRVSKTGWSALAFMIRLRSPATIQIVVGALINVLTTESEVT